MKCKTILFSIVITAACGQSKVAKVLTIEKERDNIEKKIGNNVIVLVKTHGQEDLMKVIDKQWPENIETTFNILQNQSGRIIYVAEFPTSESGDWFVIIKRYFNDGGRIIALEKEFKYFNESCTSGSVISTLIELYDVDFS